MINIEEPYLFLQEKNFVDLRGQFYESFRKEQRNPVSLQEYVQENVSISKKNVIRGLHYQWDPSMGKLIRVVFGKILDVLVDVRHKSKNYGKIYYYELSDVNMSQLWIPAGFAHGFISKSDVSHLYYKFTSEYNKNGEGGINPFDKNLSIDWGINKEDAICSDRDLNLQSFNDYFKEPKF